MAVRSPSSAARAAYHAASPAAADRQGHDQRGRPRGCRPAAATPSCAASPGTGAVDAGGRDEDRAGLDPGAGEGPVGGQQLPERGLEQRDARAAGLRGVLPGDVHRGRTLGHHQVEHPGRAVHADRDRRGEHVVRLRVGHDFPHDLSRRTPTGDVQSSRSCTPHLSSTRPLGARLGGTREHDTAWRAPARRAGDARGPDRAPAAAGDPGERGRQRRPDERDPDARQPRLDRARGDHGRRGQQDPQLPRRGHVPLRHARLHHRADRPAA